jgi:ribA/ribD-fused uncharacterized protein
MEVVEFNSKSESWGWLSNFWPSPIEVDGQVWPTVEHWFQGAKFLTGDSELAERVRCAKTAGVAKKLGKTRSTGFRSDWNSVREEVMLKGLRLKFADGTELAERLVATGSAELKEKAAWDSYWGTGRTGKGRNRMGALLMQVRNELISSNQ